MLQLSFVNFRQNSYILVEGTPATDRFFIIQSGRVKCFHELSIPGSVPAILGPGDFVGVIPCMSGHAQTESVVALTNVVAIMVRKDQYPELIMKNTPVAMKIVRAFAHDMRSLNDNLTKITLKKTIIDSPEELFKIADYYENSGHTDVATYGYYQYLKECPRGPKSEDAKRRFSSLKPRSKAVYFEATNELVRSYPRGTMIFSECQHGSDMFVIQEGSVRITKVVDHAEVTLALLKKGDMFGEMALLENKPRSASAIAHDNCRLMTINRANFDQMIATQPQMISRLTIMFADRLWGLYRQLVNTQFREPREKMIDMLALQIEKQKINAVRGMTFMTDLTISDLVNLCGLPPEYETQAVYQLQSDQNVRIVDGKINIPDVMELIRQAAFYRKQNNRRANEQ